MDGVARAFLTALATLEDLVELMPYATMALSTNPTPPASLAKKSDACRRAWPVAASRQCSQNGCDANATTCGSKSSRIVIAFQSRLEPDMAAHRRSPVQAWKMPLPAIRRKLPNRRRTLKRRVSRRQQRLPYPSP
jgi:hypothetical protein